MIEFRCPSCGTYLECLKKDRGLRVGCEKCGEWVQVPTLEDEAEVASRKKMWKVVNLCVLVTPLILFLCCCGPLGLKTYLDNKKDEAEVEKLRQEKKPNLEGPER